MTPLELVKQAHYVGRLILRNREDYLNGYTLTTTVLKDLEHYFNEDMDEIGYIHNVGVKGETVKVFNEPRKWDQSFLDKYQIIPLK